MNIVIIQILMKSKLTLQVRVLIILSLGLVAAVIVYAIIYRVNILKSILIFFHYYQNTMNILT